MINLGVQVLFKLHLMQVSLRNEIEVIYPLSHPVREDIKDVCNLMLGLTRHNEAPKQAIIPNILFLKLFLQLDG